MSHVTQQFPCNTTIPEGLIWLIFKVSSKPNQTTVPSNPWGFPPQILPLRSFWKLFQMLWSSRCESFSVIHPWRKGRIIWRAHGISILGDVQNPTRHNPDPSALDEPSTSRKVGSGDLRRCLKVSSVLSFHEKKNSFRMQDSVFWGMWELFQLILPQAGAVLLCFLGSSRCHLCGSTGRNPLELTFAWRTEAELCSLSWNRDKSDSREIWNVCVGCLCRKQPGQGLIAFFLGNY